MYYVAARQVETLLLAILLTTCTHTHVQLERVKRTKQMFIVVVSLLMFANKGRQDITIQGDPKVTIYF